MNSHMALQRERTLDDVPWEFAGDQTSYKVRVRKKDTYLWGSSEINQDMTFPSPLLLHIRNDIFGEQISVVTATAEGTTNPLGNLQPGECLSIAIQKMSGVYATCKLESMVSCRFEKS